MIELPRVLARRFRAVLRHSLLAQEQRYGWPLLVVRADPDGLTLQAQEGELAVQYNQPGIGGKGTIVFRSDLLAELEGRDTEVVRLEQAIAGKGIARWSEGGVARTVEFETVDPASVPEMPSLPREFSPLPDHGLQVLAEAVQTAPKSSVRFGLSRIQLRGKPGEVVATDGKQLLLQRGLTFPWPEDVLVPRVPAFASRELAGEGPLAIGRTASHVAVRAGGWTFFLAIDASSRFPDVYGVIPRTTSQTTRLHLNPADASFLVATLPRLPGGDQDLTPVTLDLGPRAIVRAGEVNQGQVTDVLLARSTVSGSPVRLCMDRHYLARAAKLGFLELAVIGPDKPILCKDQGRLYLWMPLAKDEALPANKNACRVSSTEHDTSPTKRRIEAMPAVPANGQNREADRPEQPPSDRVGLEEIIAEAETLRTLLQEATGRTARLLGALKQQRRQSRAVQAAMASLRQLQLNA